MRRLQARAELPRDLDRFVFGQPSDASEQGCEIFAVDVLHRQEVPAVGLSDVMDATDVGVCDLERQARFGEETLELPGVALDVARQELQGNWLTELEVVSPVHLAHATSAQQTDHAVAARQNVPGQEATAVAGLAVRRRHASGGCLGWQGTRHLGGRVHRRAAVSTEPLRRVLVRAA